MCGASLRRWWLRRSRAAAACLALLTTALAGPHAQAHQQPGPPTAPPEALAPYDDRQVSEIRFEGLERMSPQFVRNQLRTVEGQPFRAEVVTEDIQRLYRTGSFFNVSAAVELRPDGNVVLVYSFTEAQVIQDVQVVGNRQVSDQELAGIVGLLRGTPVDDFQLGRTRRAIEDLYRSKGYYSVRVEVDEEELKQGVVLFRIREGQRLKVAEIRFQGNSAFSVAHLRRNLKTEEATWFDTGPLDSDVLEQDVVALAVFYRDQGYLDVRTDREITVSPDGREAIVTFLIEEGPRYTLRRVDVFGEGGADASTLAISKEQILALMELKPGDVFGESARRRSVIAVQRAYEKLGYVRAAEGGGLAINSQELRNLDEPVVDLVVVIAEGDRYRTGEIIVQGNNITRHNVIRREIQLQSDRPLDAAALEDSVRRLEATRLFAPGVKATIQPEDAEQPGYRDVLVEVAETVTGRISFGAAVSSDSGIVGTIDISERNFDVMNPPESFSDLSSGRAFRGGGQDFSIVLAPGFEVQNYSISLNEPRLFDTDYSFGITGYYRDREFDEYDEQRFGGRLRVGRRFGDRWVGGVAIRGERVRLDDISSSAAVDVFDAEGPDTLVGFSVYMTRTTVPPGERLYPARGARTELSIEQVIGDYTFAKLSGEHQVWLTLDEDFLERKKIVTMKVAANYIPQDADDVPLYERYYLGGRSFRGFDFQGISPRGVRADTGLPGNDPVGGTWSFFAGIEYQHPVWGVDPATGRPIVAVVGFLDTGTVTNDVSFDDYRVAVGAGVRLLLPISPVPLAFDFGFPILKQDEDDEQLFSFSVDLPF